MLLVSLCKRKAYAVTEIKVVIVPHSCRALTMLLPANNVTVAHFIWCLPTIITHVELSTAGCTVIDEDGLLSIFVLEVSSILVWCCIIKMRWPASGDVMMITDLKNGLLAHLPLH